MPTTRKVTEYPTPQSEHSLIVCGVCGEPFNYQDSHPDHPNYHDEHDEYDLEPIRMELDRLAFPIVLSITQCLVAEAFSS